MWREPKISMRPGCEAAAMVAGGYDSSQCCVPYSSVITDAVWFRHAEAADYVTKPPSQRACDRDSYRGAFRGRQVRVVQIGTDGAERPSES